MKRAVMATISIVKIGKHRVYWVVHISTERVWDGVCSTRQIAVSHALAVLKRLFPEDAARLVKMNIHPDGTFAARWNSRLFDSILKEHGKGYRTVEWAIWYHNTAETGTEAREFYRRHHAYSRRRVDDTDTRGDLGTIWSCSASYWSSWQDEGNGGLNWKPEWTEHRITKITEQRIFVARGDGTKRHWQYSLHRGDLERHGRSPAGDVPFECRRIFFTEDEKRSAELKYQLYVDGMRRWGHSGQRSGSTQRACDILGLSKGYSRNDVLRAFRAKAHKTHPDHGGDPAVFRSLVEARDRALEALMKGASI